MVVDQVDDLLGDLVDARGVGLGGAGGGLEGLAVVLVEVPLAAGGLAVVVHEDAEAFAHHAVEVLEDELLAAVGPLVEGLGRAEEVAIFQDVHGDVEVGLPRLDHLGDAVLAGLDDGDALGREDLEGALDLAGEAVGVARGVEGDVADAEAPVLELHREVSHGAEEQHRALFV